MLFGGIFKPKTNVMNTNESTKHQFDIHAFLSKRFGIHNIFQNED